MEDQEKPIIIVDVWAENLEFELSRIVSVVASYPFLSIDTEFPGVIFRSPVVSSSPVEAAQRFSENYKTMKANVDSLKLIQLGITLTDFEGNLPDFGGDSYLVWQFNFKEFDVLRDPHAQDSIDLLKQQGIDFEKNTKYGIDSTCFTRMMFGSGLIFYNTRLLRWVTFHGAYDFGYLLRVLTGRPLPETIDGFYRLIHHYFGFRVYDVKQIIKYCEGVFGGLERVANSFGLKRRVGNARCAGSDSLLTWEVFRKILLSQKGSTKGHGILYGLDFDPRLAPPVHCMILGRPPLVPVPCYTPHPCYRILPSIPGFVDM